MLITQHLSRLWRLARSVGDARDFDIAFVVDLVRRKSTEEGGKVHCKENELFSFAADSNTIFLNDPQFSTDILGY